MKTYLIIGYLLSSLLLTACEKQHSNTTQRNTRAIHIAGMPVADQDFRLHVQQYQTATIQNQ